MKPHRACDADLTKLQFPLIVMPKIDGVRALNIGGKLYARTLKQHRNKYVTRLFSRLDLLGFDGELVVGSDTAPDVCRMTSSACSRIEGEPNVSWHLFDLIRADTAELGYHRRIYRLQQLVCTMIQNRTIPPEVKITVVEWGFANNMQELLEDEELYLSLGYEGVVLRSPSGLHKDGRSTVREGAYLRLKRFVEEEATVLRIEEGQTNNNEAIENELGRSARSSHQANKVLNGTVGHLVCRVNKKITYRDKQLFAPGDTIIVGPGEMPHDLRKKYFEEQHLIVGKTIKWKFFPHGQKDKPRFPTFVTIRSEEDESI